ncbi:MAG: thiamine pyrophosphate-dependent enzyme [Bacteriovoracaceae bacterium]|jgi:TPP-dependent indolepyruvate ferredoxin oxidoreductase alpha subunit
MERSLVEVISDSLLQNNFESVFNVPGFGGTEVVNDLITKKHPKTFINLNEESAFSVGYGVSFCGKRSALLIKSQGFFKALNAITSSMSTELISANLIFVFDDTEGKSSDNILPTRKVVESCELPFVVLGENPSKDIADGIKLSETMKLPVAIYVDCTKLNYKYNLKIIKNLQKKRSIKSHFTNRVACPILTQYQRNHLINRLSKIRKVGLAPKIKDIKSVLPERLVSEFVKYEVFMNVFKKHKPTFVSGDAGTSALFAFDPFNCIDSCTYMGGGPGMAVGAKIAGINDVVCITGDFSFLSAGILGFNEAFNCSIPIKIIIFSNGRAHATGGQKINPVLMNNFKIGFKKYIQTINLKKIEKKGLDKKIRTFLNEDKTSVLVLEV